MKFPATKIENKKGGTKKRAPIQDSVSISVLVLISVSVSVVASVSGSLSLRLSVLLSNPSPPLPSLSYTSLFPGLFFYVCLSVCRLWQPTSACSSYLLVHFRVSLVNHTSDSLTHAASFRIRSTANRATSTGPISVGHTQPSPAALYRAICPSPKLRNPTGFCPLCMGMLRNSSGASGVKVQGGELLATRWASTNSIRKDCGEQKRRYAR